MTQGQPGSGAKDATGEVATPASSGGSSRLRSILTRMSQLVMMSHITVRRHGNPCRRQQGALAAVASGGGGMAAPGSPQLPGGSMQKSPAPDVESPGPEAALGVLCFEEGPSGGCRSSRTELGEEQPAEEEGPAPAVPHSVPRPRAADSKQGLASPVQPVLGDAAPGSQGSSLDGEPAGSEGAATPGAPGGEGWCAAQQPCLEPCVPCASLPACGRHHGF